MSIPLFKELQGYVNTPFLQSLFYDIVVNIQIESFSINFDWLYFFTVHVEWKA